MSKLVRVLSSLALAASVIPMLLVASPAFAEGVHSPEDPSVVLGLLAAGAAALPIVRARIKSRRSKND